MDTPVKLPDFGDTAVLTDTLANFSQIVDMLRGERESQRAKWGAQSHSPNKWLVILGEEYGEACKAALEGKRENLGYELLQVAAVAISALSGLLSDGGK